MEFDLQTSLYMEDTVNICINFQRKTTLSCRHKTEFLARERERVYKKLRTFCASTTAQSDSKIIYVHKIIMQRIIINIYNIILWQEYIIFILQYYIVEKFYSNLFFFAQNITLQVIDIHIVYNNYLPLNIDN